MLPALLAACGSDAEAPGQRELRSYTMPALVSAPIALVSRFTSLSPRLDNPPPAPLGWPSIRWRRPYARLGFPLDENEAMQIHFCGGAREVGASCVLIEMAGKRILLDCGMRMKGDALPDLRTVQEAGGLDAIVLSHAHMDHSGSLPVISQAYPKARIHLTHPTLALVRVLLLDSLKLMAQEEEIPTFDRRHVELMLSRVAPQGMSDPTEILDGVQLTFHYAGHILGAASVELSSRDGSVFYTGDISVDAQRTVGGLAAPRLRPTALILETTYGDRLHAERRVEEERLCETVGERLERGARVLVPAFAVGRAQEVILTLRAAMLRKHIPEAPIYIDGMVREICRIYRLFPNYLRESLAKSIFKGHDPFFRPPVQAVEDREAREAVLRRREPCCIISSSGMLSGGPSVYYAQELAADPEALIAITGYQDEESPGRRLQNLFAREPGRTGEGTEPEMGSAAYEPAAGEPAAYEPAADEPAAYQPAADEPAAYQPAADQPAANRLATKQPTAAHAENGGRTWTIQGRDVPLNCRLGTFGLSAHADRSQLLGLINRLAPRELFLVHGDPSVIDRFGPEAQAVLRGRVHVPANGASFLVDSSASRRARPSRRLPPALGKQGVPSPEELTDLASHLLAHDAAGPWTARELIQAWGGRSDCGAEEETAWTQLLNDSPHFECDRRRLFLFRAVQPAEPVEEWPLEVNRMLALAGRMFPPETGCYRTGARVEQHIARLLFRFPAVARELHAERIHAFERQSGWSVEINTHPDTSFIRPLLDRLLGDDADRIAKVAWHLDRGVVSVTLAGEGGVQESVESWQTAFRRETGLALTIVTAGETFSAASAAEGDHGAASTAAAESPAPSGPTPSGPLGTNTTEEGRLTQQQAMLLISDVLSREDVTVYKQSVRADDTGPYLELLFLTPAIGRRYVATIEALAAETGWRIGWSPHPRQQDLIALARRPFDEDRIGIAKGPSILPHGCVRVKLAAPIPPERAEDVRARFRKQSGFELEIVSPESG